jgi:hypothetical protein
VEAVTARGFVGGASLHCGAALVQRAGVWLLAGYRVAAAPQQQQACGAAASCCCGAAAAGVLSRPARPWGAAMCACHHVHAAMGLCDGEGGEGAPCMQAQRRHSSGGCGWGATHLINM